MLPFDPALVEDTPEVVVDLARLRRNVEAAAVAAAARGLRLRPHAKTHKMVEAARLQLEAGAVGIQVAKLGEAGVFAQAGIDDIFVGYPIVGRQKLDRLVRLLERATISVCVDGVEMAEPLAAAARAASVEIRALLEIDTGQHRDGVAGVDAALETARRVATLRSVELVGVFTHEGHVYGARSPEELERTARDACACVVEIAEAIRADGLALPVVSVGSSVSFRHAVDCPGITEVRPGVYVFNDRSQVGLGAATLDTVAAFVVATVVARPAPDRAIVDAGSKVLAMDPLSSFAAGGGHGELLGHEGAVVSRLSEEHGVVEVPSGVELQVGERVVVVPNHICPVINLADSVCVVEDGVALGRWQVAARGRVR